MNKTLLLSSILIVMGLRTQAAIFTNDFTGIGGVIPDARMVGYVNRQTVSGITGIITNVNVRLNIANGYNGDLFGYLVGPDGGFTLLLNRVGTGSGDPAQTAYGFADTGFNITLKDGLGNTSIHNVNGGGSLVSGIYQSEDNTLNTAFDGQAANGYWTLFLADLSGGEQSTLVSWGVDIYVQSPTSLAVASSANPSVSGQSVSFTATVTGTGGTPIGNVIFRTNGVALSTNLLNGSGVATSASTASLPVGTNTVTAQYASGQDGNFIGSTNSLDGGYGGQVVNSVVISSNTISGTVALQSFIGTNRLVRFILSDSTGPTYLQTNDVTLTFSGGTASYNLTVPTNTTHISAKTAWNLRRRQAVSFSGGAATVNFTAATTNVLKGGDIITVAVPPGTIDDTDNAVASPDYLLLLANYLQTVNGSAAIGRADIDGDGVITSSDYLNLLGNYLTSGDAP